MLLSTKTLVKIILNKIYLYHYLYNNDMQIYFWLFIKMKENHYVKLFPNIIKKINHLSF